MLLKTSSTRVRLKSALGMTASTWVVAPVGDVKVAVPVLCYAPREIELTVAVAKRTPFGQNLAILRVLLNPVVSVVDHDQVFV